MARKTLSASQKFEGEAKRWEETGELQWSGQNEYGFLQLECWLLSDGAKADGAIYHSVRNRCNRVTSRLHTFKQRWGK
jgi:hypothetical protein